MPSQLSQRNNRPMPEDVPHFRFATPSTRTRADFGDLSPGGGDQYEKDIRTSHEYDEVPEHVTAAKQRINAMQFDSYGPSPRGIVPPPPPLPNDWEDPKPYYAPRVNLDSRWWPMVGSFAVIFALMAHYGK